VGAAFFIMMGLTVMFSIPLITASFAKRMGRSAMKWFFIGIILPVIASFILFFLPDLSEKEVYDSK
jgi:Na+/melibiose symporter-like transporter